MRDARFASIAIVIALSDLGLAVSAFPQSVNADTYAPEAQDDEAPASSADDISRAAVRVFDVNTTFPTTVAVPPNLLVPDILRTTVETMLRTSPTFRRQCARLANAQNMVVTIGRMGWTGDLSARARAVFASSPDGRRVARIEIRPADDQVELLAHELEHVIEQLDEINLRTMASVPGSGVERCRGREEAYETIRAIRAGRAAADEVRRQGS
jgi:hypothetical protein